MNPRFRAFLRSAALGTLLAVVPEVPAHAQSTVRVYAYRGMSDWAKLPSGRSWGAPSGVDIDPDGTSVWVIERCGDFSGPGCAESDVAPVLKFDASGRLVTSFGAGMFLFPHGISVDREGNVWVTDGRGREGKGHQVFKFSPDGRLLLALGQPGMAGEGHNTLNRPSDVAIAPNGDIFVADGHSGMDTNQRIVKYSPDGTYITEWGHKGSAPGELNGAHGLAFDSAGRLFVADRENHRIQIFDQDGRFIDAWSQFGTPSGLYITQNDILYVADYDVGIRIGSAQDGAVTGFIRAAEPGGDPVRVAESVAVDRDGVVYGGENANKQLMRIVLPR